MKKMLLSTPAFILETALAAFCLAACGDDIESVNQTGIEVVSTENKLPECTQENEGKQAFVKEDETTLTCINGSWKGETAKFTCRTEELKDKTGSKIICNGDSIGVVQNGAKGESGIDSKGCTVSAQTDSTVTISCTGENTTIKLDRSGTSIHDSESIATPMDSLVGYTQKGPFLKGSTVFLYELESGRTLKQTNGNFTSNIIRDDGRYKFAARDLASQYAMIIVEGYYRNEVTGKSSDNAIRLKAYTDLSKHTAVNVNLLTHLESERVYHLVTKEKKKVYEAKRQAQKEILKIFGIELESNTDAEELNVFGNTEADAALLALSVLLQGDRTEAELTALITEISIGIAENAAWENDHADSIKASIADWAFSKELSIIRKNVEDWNLSNGKPVGDFEKLIESYIMSTYNLELCVNKDNGKERTINNKWSVNNGNTFYCRDGKMIAKRDPKNLNPNVEYGEMIDWRDRKPYKTVEIGGLTWMAEDLDYDYKVKGNLYGTPTESNAEGDVYGRHYTWGAAMDSAGIFSENSKYCGDGRNCTAELPARGICPEGWHIPAESEWNALITAIGGREKGYTVQAKGFEGWPDATDEYGFSALPAVKNYTNNGIPNPKLEAFFWGICEGIYSRYACNSGIRENNIYFGVSYEKGSHIRCVRD